MIAPSDYSAQTNPKGGIRLPVLFFESDQFKLELGEHKSELAARMFLDARHVIVKTPSRRSPQRSGR